MSQTASLVSLEASHQMESVSSAESLQTSPSRSQRVVKVCRALHEISIGLRETQSALRFSMSASDWTNFV